MLKKIASLVIILSFIFTSISVIALDSNEETDNNLLKLDSVLFSDITLGVEGEFLTVNLEGFNSHIEKSGEPDLPVDIQTYTFPAGTKINSVICEPQDIETRLIEGTIKPTAHSKTRTSLTNSEKNKQLEEYQDELKEENILNQGIYSSSEFYPKTWYEYSVGRGIKDDKDVIFLKVIKYPIRYSPLENKIEIASKMDVEISYIEPVEVKDTEREYDLIIIAPLKFSKALRSLVFHKNLHGVKTKLKSLESIYLTYSGRDNPEKIKYFIKDAKETWNVKYVLFVGGLKSYINANDREHINYGSRAWHFPVRYTNIIDNDKYVWLEDEERWWHNESVGAISDLYYADIYKYNYSTGQDEFDDWDSNDNEIMVEGDITWSPYEIEEIDYYPDVYYGRLACRNILEVITVVNKIKKYERTPVHNEEWFKTMITVGGQTFERVNGEPDGEYLCNLSIEAMGDLIDNPIRVFASDFSEIQYKPTPEDLIEVYSKGAGFMLFQGHGNPFIWDTHWANKSTHGNWTGGLMVFHYPLITNGRKLPIVVVGGCHNALFNITMVKTLLDPTQEEAYQNYYWTYHVPTPSCFSWRMVSKPNGGAIATTGCTGFGLGSPGIPESLSAELENNFFYKIGQEDIRTVGEAHGGSIEKYLSQNIIDGDDGYCMTIYQLFGDPSLRIGGYS